eukprot:g5082.t1
MAYSFAAPSAAVASSAALLYFRFARRFLSRPKTTASFSSTESMDIRTCTSLGEVVPEVDERTVVFLDVDETLLRASLHAGSERWEKAMTAELQRLGCSKDMAWRSSCFAWQALQRVVPMEACEGATTAAVVAELQAKAAAVFGLTARHPSLATRTVGQLQKNGIVLDGGADELPVDLPRTESDPLGSRGGGKIDAEEWSAWFQPPIARRGGVWFCCGPRKLEAALAALRALPGPPPTRVILVDDRRSHLEQIAAGISGIDPAPFFVGFHLAHPAAAKLQSGLDETSRMLAQLL